MRKDWQLKKYIGEEVEVNLYKKDENGQKDYTAILREVTDEYIILQSEEKQIKIDKKNISQVKWGKI